MTLNDAQHLFWSILHQRSSDGAAIEACFEGSPTLSPKERVEIYADMYRWRILDALHDDFPMVAALLGDEAFWPAAEAYLDRFPSDDPNLSGFGRRLGAFLRDHPDTRGRPELAELAELEWARSLAFSAPDAEPDDGSCLASLDPESFAAARLELIPALRTLHVEHDLAELWERLVARDEAADEPIDPPLAQPVTLAIWRQGFDVYHARVEPPEDTALEQALAGATLGVVCAAFEGLDDPAAAAFAALRAWVADGWIAGLAPEDPNPSSEAAAGK